MFELRLYLLGPPRLERQGEPIELNLRKAMALLVYLAVTRGEFSRDELATLFWPENDQSSARANLRRTLYQTNKIVGGDMFSSEGDILCLDPEINIWTDVAVFLQYLREGNLEDDLHKTVDPARLRVLERAVAIYRGDFLSGFSLPDCLQFDEWQFFESETLRGALASALIQLSSIYESRCDFIAAIGHARRWLSIDPLHEPAHRMLMRLYAKAGEQAAAVRQYQECVRILESELGIPPQEETNELYHNIRLRRETGGTPVIIARPEVKYVASGDVHIAYTVLGDGPVDIICVFGYVTHLEIFWELPAIVKFFSELASNCRVILFDRRGVGLSDRVGYPPTMETTMDDILAVMRAVGSKHAILFGYLEGGPNSILFTATYPERVSGLILYATCAKWTRSEDYPWAITQEQYDRWLQNLSDNWGEALNIETYAPNYAHEPQLQRWLAKIMRQSSSPGGIKAVLEVMRDIDVRHILPAIRTPTLIMHRKGDQAIRVGAGRYLAGQIPGAKYVEFDGEDHWFFIGESQPILKEMKTFIAGLGSPAIPERLLTTILLVEMLDDVYIIGRSLTDRIQVDTTLASMRQEVTRFRGNEVNWSEGRFTATFDGPSRALHCARAILISARKTNTNMRASLHTGECEFVSGAIKGIAVQIAEGILNIASSGEILVTGTIKDLVVGSGFQFSRGDRFEIDGVSGLWQTFSVAGDPVSL